MGVDVIDFSDLQKRGLLKKRVESKVSTLPQAQGGILDLSTPFSSSSVSPSSTSVSSTQDNPFDLLGSLAQAASNSSSSPSVYGSSSSSQDNVLHDKIDRLTNVLERIESRLDRVEQTLSYRG